METKEQRVQDSPMPRLVSLAELDEMPRVPGTCEYCMRDTMVYALILFTCRKCVLEDMEAFGEVQGPAVPAKPSRPRSPSALAEQRNATCANCRKPIRRTGAGADWYHRLNASTSCYPGSRSWKRAQPREVD